MIFFEATILQLYGYTGPGITWANEMIFSMNHAPSAGSIAQLLDLQCNTLPLCHCLPRHNNKSPLCCVSIYPLPTVPSHEIFAACRPIRCRDLLDSRPSLSRWIPSFVILLWPRFSVSRLWVEYCNTNI